ncbi:HER028Cp [Eremothecium sinecaudum]|uniref:HER028Cp n=1 Tax=Eremothecium sinecaudum TaxID=45286 RepID=A0A0X8HTN3_9SACH|nr:HER028Cp [Eremothecium sinecaudum]AMD21307.1 HER028Cp [Eremothecium sinecaudum]
MSEESSLVGSGAKGEYTNSLLATSIVACLGSLQFGYHLAALNAPQNAIMCRMPLDPSYGDTWLGRNGWKQCIELSDSQFGLVTSLFIIGGLGGALYSGILADRLGRRGISLLNCVFTTLGSLFMFCSNSYAALVFGRMLAGLGCGSGVIIAALYVNEVAPRSLRGSLGTFNQILINTGILLTQGLALLWANSLQWRWILLSAVVIGVASAGLLLLVDESPRWLASKGDQDSAIIVLERLRNCSYRNALQETDSWKKSVGRESNLDQKDASMFEYLTSSRYSRERMVVAAILIGQQLCGISVIIFYGTKLIGTALPKYSVHVNLAVSFLNLFVTLLAAGLIEKHGRRPLLLVSCIAMAICSVFITAGSITHNGLILTMSTLSYICSFAIGMGPIPLLIIQELSSSKSAVVAQSFGLIVNWLATFGVGVAFPAAYQAIGGYMFSVFGILSIGLAAFIWTFVPETMNKHNYEEIWGMELSN